MDEAHGGRAYSDGKARPQKYARIDW